MAADQASHARRRLEFQKSYSLEVNAIINIINPVKKFPDSQKLAVFFSWNLCNSLL